MVCNVRLVTHVPVHTLFPWSTRTKVVTCCIVRQPANVLSFAACNLRNGQCSRKWEKVKSKGLGGIKVANQCRSQAVQLFHKMCVGGKECRLLRKERDEARRQTDWLQRSAITSERKRIEVIFRSRNEYAVQMMCSHDACYCLLLNESKLCTDLKRDCLTMYKLKLMLMNVLWVSWLRME